jgi:hypothetical protein
VAGLSLFLLFTIVIGSGPGVPRFPSRTIATVLKVKHDPVNQQYVAIVTWTNKGQVVDQQEEAWPGNRIGLLEGAIVPAVVFHETWDMKARVSPDRVGIGSLRDYWFKRGFWDWGFFWGPILILIPSTWLAYAMTKAQKRAPLSHSWV